MKDTDSKATTERLWITAAAALLLIASPGVARAQECASERAEIERLRKQVAALKQRVDELEGEGTKEQKERAKEKAARGDKEIPRFELGGGDPKPGPREEKEAKGKSSAKTPKRLDL